MLVQGARLAGQSHKLQSTTGKEEIDRISRQSALPDSRFPERFDEKLLARPFFLGYVSTAAMLARSETAGDRPLSVLTVGVR